MLLVQVRIWYQLNGDSFANKQEYALPCLGRETATVDRSQRYMEVHNARRNWSASTSTAATHHVDPTGGCLPAVLLFNRGRGDSRWPHGTDSGDLAGLGRCTEPLPAGPEPTCAGPGTQLPGLHVAAARLKDRASRLRLPTPRAAEAGLDLPLQGSWISGILSKPKSCPKDQSGQKTQQDKQTYTSRTWTID